MRILFLDDDPNRHVKLQNYIRDIDKIDVIELDACFTAKEAIDLLSKNKYDLVHLDHDLGGEVFVTKTENTGYEVALWLEANVDKAQVGRIIIHTFNPAGAEKMMKALNQHYDVSYVPFNYY